MTETPCRIGDTRQLLHELPAASLDLVLTSPPLLELRSCLPAGHPDKNLEKLAEATPGEFIDNPVGVLERLRRVFAGSGGAGGDYRYEVPLALDRIGPLLLEVQHDRPARDEAS